MQFTRRHFLGQIGLTATTAIVSTSVFGQQPKSPKHPRAVEEYLKGVYDEANQPYILHAFKIETFSNVWKLCVKRVARAG